MVDKKRDRSLGLWRPKRGKTLSHRVPPSEAYFAVAELLMPGTRLLAATPSSNSAAALALLSGQNSRVLAQGISLRGSWRNGGRVEE